ncbi:MAG: hypothetical protein Hens2KO_25440 [Henriciella sp.]
MTLSAVRSAGSVTIVCASTVRFPPTFEAKAYFSVLQSDPGPPPISFRASPPDERLVRIGWIEGESGGLVAGLGAPNPLRGTSRGSSARLSDDGRRGSNL